NETGGLEVFRLQRHVGGPEGHRLGLDLLDAAARTDRLVIQPDAGLRLIGRGPFRIDRIGERRPRARDIRCLRARPCECRKHRNSENTFHSMSLPLPVSETLSELKSRVTTSCAGMCRPTRPGSPGSLAGL